MKNNEVRHNLLAGVAQIGCFMGLGSPNVAELLTRAGLDWLVIETEHNNLDVAQIEHILMAVQGSGAMPIVRVASSQQVYIQRALDVGAMGVLVPMVRSVAEAEAIVAATRFPPEGRRSFGPLRASHYSLDNEDYLRRANDNILVALIVETREMLDNLEDIAAVPGVDVLFLGPFDLCLSLGLDPLQLPLPEVDAVLERMLEVGRVTGKAVGYAADSPEGLRALQAQGVTFVSYGQDYGLLLRAIREGVAAFGNAPALD